MYSAARRHRDIFYCCYRFSPRDAAQSAVLLFAAASCLSVRLSVRLWRWGVVTYVGILRK